jgi:hypothetical protein
VNLGSAASFSVNANASAARPETPAKPPGTIAGAPGASRRKRKATDAISARPANAAKLRLADRGGKERERGTTTVTRDILTTHG